MSDTILNGVRQTLLRFLSITVLAQLQFLLRVENFKIFVLVVR